MSGCLFAIKSKLVFVDLVGGVVNGNDAKPIEVEGCVGWIVAVVERRESFLSPCLA